MNELTGIVNYPFTVFLMNQKVYFRKHFLGGD